MRHSVIPLLCVVAIVLASAWVTGVPSASASAIITLDRFGHGTYSVDGGTPGTLPYLGVVAPNLYGMPGHATACYGLSDSSLWISPAIGDLVVRESTTPVSPDYYSSTEYPAPYSAILRFGYYQTDEWVPPVTWDDGEGNQYTDPGYFVEVPAVFVYSKLPGPGEVEGPADTGLPAVWARYGGSTLWGTVIAREGNNGTATYTPWLVTSGYGYTAGGDSSFGATPGSNFGTLTYNFTTAVPEPSTFALLGMAALGGLAWRRLRAA